MPSLEKKFVRCSNRLQVEDVIKLLKKRLSLPAGLQVLFM